MPKTGTRKKPLSIRRKPSQERSRETLEAIIEAAAQVFSALDYERGTVSRIATRAGVSVGSLYQYFPSKDAIIVALMERHMDETARMIAGMAEHFGDERPSLDEVIRLFVGAILETYRRDVGLIRVMVEEAPRPAAINQRQAEVMWLVAREIERLLSPYPEITLPDMGVASHLIVTLVDSQIEHYLLHTPPGYEPQAFVEGLVALLKRYLTATDA